MKGKPVKIFTEQVRSELRDTILDLAMNCPVEYCNPDDCPLFRVRQLDLPARLVWFRSLTDEDLAYLHAYHCVCMRNKLGLKPAPPGK